MYYNKFIVNKYVNWINDLPEDIKETVGIDKKYEEVEVSDNILEASDEEERDRIWKDLDGRSGGLYKREGDNKIKIKRGKEIKVISELIDSGNLPFSPNKIQKEDLKKEPENVELRDYQERAWEKFKETGMIGVYWPPGVGKTFFSLYAGERISGKN